MHKICNKLLKTRATSDHRSGSGVGTWKHGFMWHIELQSEIQILNTYLPLTNRRAESSYAALKIYAYSLIQISIVVEPCPQICAFHWPGESQTTPSQPKPTITDNGRA